MSDVGNFIKDTMLSMNAVYQAGVTGDMSHLHKLGAIKRPIPASAKIEPRVGVSMTEYRITGDLPNVLKAITSLFEQYDPRGYGTRVHTLEMSGVGPHYVARMSRSNSCE